MKQYVAAKIHGIRVTHKELDYHGSVTIPESLCRDLDIEEFEWIYCVNSTNGQRWETYVLYGLDQEMHLNGGGARLGEIGDKCILFTKQICSSFQPAKVVELDEKNIPITRFTYRQE